MVAGGATVLRGMKRQRIWTFWRRVLHTCHHRTQVETWLRLAGQHVPANYGPSGDVRWEGRRSDLFRRGGQSRSLASTNREGAFAYNQEGTMPRLTRRTRFVTSTSTPIERLRSRLVPLRDTLLTHRFMPKSTVWPP